MPADDAIVPLGSCSGLRTCSMLVVGGVAVGFEDPGVGDDMDLVTEGTRC